MNTGEDLGVSEKHSEKKSKEMEIVMERGREVAKQKVRREKERTLLQRKERLGGRTQERSINKELMRERESNTISS